MPNMDNQDIEKRETAVQQFYIPDPFARSGGLWPLNTGLTRARPSYHIGPRLLEYFNLHFIRDGQLEISYSGQHIVLDKGDVFAMFPGIVYRYRRVGSTTTTELQMTWISFDGPQAEQLLNWSGFTPDKPYVRQVVNTELELVLRQLYTRQPVDERRQVEVCSLLYRIFSLMIRSAPPLRSAGQEVWLTRCMEYMHTHYMEKITVHDVADYVSVHRVHFSKVFTERTGLTPMKYLQKLRMEKAAELLQADILTIEEVALTLGYPDPYSFNRAFGKYYDMPPGKWRRRVSDNPT
ncbi:helix-turn-helix transcriptional regulator [Paenibacillus puerhi]|uniref:helix-turn-helix transcriptional regulator n=1 Tax=Paenibacillus puerhi TaxID=2692622 RepID=UPI00135B7642|nr:AraC family transcriptional regulator [Paenibacillus puerhi]